MIDETYIMKRAIEIYLKYGKLRSINYVYKFWINNYLEAKRFIENNCTPTKVKISAYELMDL